MNIKEYIIEIVPTKKNLRVETFISSEITFQFKKKIYKNNEIISIHLKCSCVQLLKILVSLKQHNIFIHKIMLVDKNYTKIMSYLTLKLILDDSDSNDSLTITLYDYISSEED